jgi:tetratricopeptide (TPR) repeat protein
MIDYVEQFLGSLEYLSKINMETYKFVGRVMFENKLMGAALKYFEQAKDIYYNDPELHFLLSKYYFKIYKYDDAMFYINECLKLLPDYYPALLQKDKIEQMMI